MAVGGDNGITLAWTALRRRDLLRACAGLPVLGALLTLLLLGDEQADAQGRRKRRKKAHKHGTPPGSRKRGKGRKGNGKSKQPSCASEPRSETCDSQCGGVTDNCGKDVDCGPCTCEPACGACETCSDRLVCEACAACCDGACCPRADAVCHAASGACCVRHSRARTCDGHCGAVTDNCGFTVDCGACTCASACDACLVCDDESGTCVADSTQKDQPCGEHGQRCQANGTCSCDPNSCAACETCQENGRCSAPCDGAGCCDANGACHDGDSAAMCGRDGEACVACGEEICRAEVQGGTCRVNQPPEAFADTVNDGWGKTCIVLTLRGADTDGDPLAFRILSKPINGKLFVYDEDAVDHLGAEVRIGDSAVPAEVGTNSLRLCYKTNNRFFFGQDSFRYIAVDTHGAESPFKLIQINVLDVLET